MCSHCRKGRGAGRGARGGRDVIPLRRSRSRDLAQLIVGRFATARSRHALRACGMTGLLLLTAACGSGDSRPVPALSTERAVVLTSDLQAGSPIRGETRNPLEGDQRALAEGERLYLWMNCAGCHGAKGGGGMGPPFRDADWIYGRDPAALHQSIRQGRPNGMPAFGGKLPDAQIWQIVLYVEKLADEGAQQAQSARAAGAR
jgi:cytochrome c oxidase cbb3-type subunit 3